MAGNVGVWGWDTANTEWVKILVDATGHLQVDVVTSGLPLGGATAANQALIIADTGTLVTEQGRCYGWTGAAWTPLLVESLASANLRTRLYDGVNPVVSVGTAADIADANRGLLTQAGIRGWDGTFWKSVNVEDNAGDALANDRASLSTIGKLYGWNGVTWDRLEMYSAAGSHLKVALYAQGQLVASNLMHAGSFVPTGMYSLCATTNPHLWQSAILRTSIKSINSLGDGTDGRFSQAAGLFGYNGATWDRLRTYPTGILKVGRAEIDSTTIRKTVAGAVVAGAHNLYWISCSPDGPGSEFELTDAIAGGGAVVFDHADADKHSEVIHLDPPMKFTTGIWIEKFDHIKSLVFCYI